MRTWQSKTAIRQQYPDEAKERGKRESSGESLHRLAAQGPFFVTGLPRRALLLRRRGIHQHVFGIGEEDFPPPEGHEGEEEEDSPGDADEDDHDAVPHDEPGKIENVRQDSDDGDETHIGKPVTKIAFSVNGGNRTLERGSLRERPAAEDLAEVFVELEPVRKDSENEQENGKTEQHNSGHYAHSVPNFPSGLCHETMERQTKREAHVERTPRCKRRKHTFAGRYLRV